MAIYYIDLVNGNDANAGTSWGTAWKTFTNGATAARIAPGDEIRCSETTAPTSIGTATWTSGKVGNSITFASAPTKQIDTCKSGWVTMGAGSTVTNAQTTAYMTPISFGSTTVGALQVTTSAASNLAYKALGATVDYSGYQQISFWFRSGSAFDCTGTQNMNIRLCSDTAGTTVVNTIAIPKWSYAANTWYPIVIDNGSALGSNIQSVSITTTNTTTQTFYFDEMFASPASGLTLNSLIGLNDNDWHAIKCVRDADVQLLAGFQAGTAAGGTAYLGTIDASWVGTTQTSTTYKLEPFRGLIPTTGPSSTTYGVNVTESGNNSAPHIYSGGWNVSTGLQTGITFLDGGTHISSSVGIQTTASPYTVVDNFGLVRFNAFCFSTSQLLFKNITSVACPGTNLTSTPDAIWLNTMAGLGYTEYSFKSQSGGYNFTNIPMIQTYTPNTTISLSYGNIWGFTSNSTGVNTGTTLNTNITFKNVYPAPCGNVTCSISGNFSMIAMDDYIQCGTNQTSANTTSFFALTGNNNNIKCKNVNLRFYSPVTMTGYNNILTVDSVTGPGSSGGYIYSGTVSGLENKFYIKAFSASADWFGPFSTGANTKVYFHNYTNITNYFRVYLNDINNSGALKYFELQSTDVYTPGSKAIQFTGPSYSTTSGALNQMFDLKIASAAVVANKLVTVTARVKRNSTSVSSGIYIPAFNLTVPGYTSDIVASNTTTNTWELLTITFTPTADCVFDVNAWFKCIGTVSPNVVWDALSITQAP